MSNWEDNVHVIKYLNNDENTVEDIAKTHITQEIKKDSI